MGMIISNTFSTFEFSNHQYFNKLAWVIGHSSMLRVLGLEVQLQRGQGEDDLAGVMWVNQLGGGGGGGSLGALLPVTVSLQGSGVPLQGRETLHR